MIKPIYVPRDLAAENLVISELNLQHGDRVRKGQVLMMIGYGNNVVQPIVSPYDGWARDISVKEGQTVSSGWRLMNIDVIMPNDYRAQSDEVNLQTELGEQGRRGAERKGQKKFGKGYSGNLFEAPEQGQLAQQSALREHPFTQNMKEGVPPKMSANAAQNDPAIDKLSEEASHDPELKKQMSNQLQAQLDLRQAPSISPTPSPH